jgi:hypothetical protein
MIIGRRLVPVQECPRRKRISTMPAFRFVAFAVALLLPALSASAASIGERERAARKACLTGDVGKGVELLADLFLDTRDITHLFNQGRCLEQNRRFAEAISRFQEYLVKGENLSEEARADAQKHIELCQKNLGPAATPPIPPPEPAPPVVSSPAAGPDTLGITKPAALPPGSSGLGLRTTGIVLAAVGGAALVTGLVLNLKYIDMTRDLEKPYSYSRGDDSSRMDYKTGAWIGYGAGAALVAGGGILYYLGWTKRNATRASLHILPMPVAHGGGSMLAGSF